VQSKWASKNGKPRFEKRPSVDAGLYHCGQAYLTTLPPAALQSLAESFMFQPWPLQLFMPLHSFLAVLQSDVPLQLLIPEHLTAMSSAACATVRGAPTANKAAAALAMAIADLKLDDMVFPLTVKNREKKSAIRALALDAFASACGE
jgi:hypothetical protein